MFWVTIALLTLLAAVVSGTAVAVGLSMLWERETPPMFTAPPARARTAEPPAQAGHTTRPPAPLIEDDAHTRLVDSSGPRVPGQVHRMRQADRTELRETLDRADPFVLDLLHDEVPSIEPPLVRRVQPPAPEPVVAEPSNAAPLIRRVPRYQQFVTEPDAWDDAWNDAWAMPPTPASEPPI